MIHLWLALVLACGGQTPPAQEQLGASSDAGDVEPDVASSGTEAQQVDFSRWALVPPRREARTPVATPLDAEGTRVRAVLENVVRTHALDPQNPWALTHALVALGPDAAVPGGDSVTAHLFAHWAQPISVGDRVALRFPRSVGEVRVEPHTDLVLKALVDAGVPPTQSVTVGQERFTVEDLYWGSLDRAWVDGDAVSYDGWNDVPWALRGLAAWAPPHQARWRTSDGHTMDMDLFTDATVARLAQEQAFLAPAAASGGSVPKRGQHIFGYTCGGAHLFQGAAFAVARGHGSAQSRESVQAQLPILFFRLRDELAQVDAGMRAQPKLAPVLLIQRLKFLGHFLESAHGAAAMELFSPDEHQRSELAFAQAQLLATVAIIEKMQMFEKIPELRAVDEQLTLDLIGDSAHALHGLDLATGRAAIRY